MKKKFTFPIIVLFVAALGFLALQMVTSLLSDYQEYTYKTYADALNAGVIEQGWLPEFVPETATDIHLGYDIDTNDILLTFDKGDTDFTSAPGCIPTEQQGSHALDAKWWSDAFYDDPSTQLFHCGAESWLAVNGDTVWYWDGLKEIKIKDLTRHPKSYKALDGKQVTLTGYVDFYNVFDTRLGEDRDSFALIPNFDKVGENAVFVHFDQQEDAFALLDELHNQTLAPTSKDISVQLALSGRLRAFEEHLNLGTYHGFEMHLHDLGSITFFTAVGDSLPNSISEFNHRIQQELPNAKYPFELAAEGWVQLRQGYAVVSQVQDSSSSLRVVLREIHTGDLNNDNLTDAATLLTADSGGSESFFYLTAALNGADGLLPVDTVFLGDCIRIEGLHIQAGEIVVTCWTRPDNALISNEPTGQILRRFNVQDGYLIEVTAR